jgi:alpha-amylase
LITAVLVQNIVKQPNRTTTLSDARIDARALGAIALMMILAACGVQHQPTRGQAEADPAAAAATISKVPVPDRDVFVHLFEWDWTSVARECEEFLGPAGYDAVQVSPPQEHAQGPQWYTRYQPVSYRLISRSGNRQEFVDMIDRCGAVGVDVYVDAVINHMTGVRSDVSLIGTPFGEYDYPPLYDYDDFNHCGRNGNDDIVNFSDVWEMQHCELVNLADLKTDSPKVRATLAAYLNDLLSIGVAGFRLDAAKHMPAGDIAAILSLLDKPTFVFQEVIAGIDGPLNRRDYTDNAHVTEFQYLPRVHDAFTTGNLAGLQQLGPAIGLLPADLAVVFVDNHDTQRHDEGHAFSYKMGERYVLANIFMLAWPYGYPKVMSSFEFEDTAAGRPPAEPVTAGAARCNAGWVCEHRLPAIANMVAFRSATAGMPVTHWQQHDDGAISFGRGNAGHVVINAGDLPVTVDVRTNLPEGDYCNLLTSGAAADCETAVRVSGAGRFQATLDPMSALALLNPL